MKRVLLVLVGLAILFTLWACSNSSTGTDSAGDDQVEIVLAFPGADGNREIVEKVLEEFYKEHPNIKVELLYVPNTGWADYFNKLKTMVAGGNAPDVTRVAIEGVQMLVKDGLAEPLDEYMDMYPEIVENYEDIHPKLQSAFIVDGKNYGITWDWNNVVMHINTQMLEEAGLPMPSADWDIDEFLRYAEALTTEKDGQKVYGFAIPNYYFGASAWLFNNEASILNDDWTASTLDDPNAIEVLQLFQDLIHKYGFAPQPSPEEGAINQMINGQVAMHAAGRWPFVNYKENGIDYIDVQYLPTMKTNQVIFGSGAFPVMKSSENKEAAFKLSTFLGGSFSQKEFLEDHSIPTRISVMEEVLPVSGPDNWQVFSDSADISRAVESPPQYAAIASIFDRYMSAVLANEMDAETAMKLAKDEIDAELQK